ncbi:RhoA signalling inhibitor [Equine molluscum contagiosum-like virus]|nr:RhoA signalling inhibitor [Equine molluscum contagiosum-like virus]
MESLESTAAKILMNIRGRDCTGGADDAEARAPAARADHSADFAADYLEALLGDVIGASAFATGAASSGGPAFPACAASSSAVPAACAASGAEQPGPSAATLSVAEACAAVAAPSAAGANAAATACEGSRKRKKRMPLVTKKRRGRPRAVPHVSPVYVRREPGAAELFVHNTVMSGSTTLCDGMLAERAHVDGMQYARGDTFAYYWKQVPADPARLAFLADEDAFYQVSDAFLIRMDHGCFFRGRPLFLDNGCGFQAVICLSSSGAAALGVAHSNIVERCLRPCDYLVTRCTHHLQFLPQMVGVSVYLLVKITPTTKFFDCRVRCESTFFQSARDAAFEAAAEKWARAVRLVNSILAVRVEAEKCHLRVVMLRELQKLYDDVYAAHVGEPCTAIEVCDDLYAAELHVQEVVSAAHVALDTVTQPETRADAAVLARLQGARERAELHLRSMREKYAAPARTEQRECFLGERLRKDLDFLARSHAGMCDTLDKLAREVSLIVPGVRACIDKFVAARVEQCDAVQYRDKLVQCLLSLQGVGIPSFRE